METEGQRAGEGGGRQSLRCWGLSPRTRDLRPLRLEGERLRGGLLRPGCAASAREEGAAEAEEGGERLRRGLRRPGCATAAREAGVVETGGVSVEEGEGGRRPRRRGAARQIRVLRPRSWEGERLRRGLRRPGCAAAARSERRRWEVGVEGEGDVWRGETCRPGRWVGACCKRVQLAPSRLRRSWHVREQAWGDSERSGLSQEHDGPIARGSGREASAGDFLRPEQRRVAAVLRVVCERGVAVATTMPRVSDAVFAAVAAPAMLRRVRVPRRERHT